MYIDRRLIFLKKLINQKKPWNHLLFPHGFLHFRSINQGGTLVLSETSNLMSFLGLEPPLEVSNPDSDLVERCVVVVLFFLM